MTISSATAMTLWIAMVIAGGVSITARRKPCWRRTSRSEASRATVVCAKAGMSAWRSFHQSARLPCGSISIRQTGPAPASCACTARCPDRVVLPDPPFCDAIARTRIPFPSPNDGDLPSTDSKGPKNWLMLTRPCLVLPRGARVKKRAIEGVRKMRNLLLALAIAVSAAPTGAQSVRAGIDAWQKGDTAGAVAIWRPLAEKGDADAAFNLGQAYRLGKGVPLDLAQAQVWLERAARKGHVDAQSTLGLLMFQNGNQVGAMRWLRPAAEAGEPRAMLMVGTALYNGDGVPADPVTAYAYVSRAAAQGLAPAQSTLADLDEVMPLEQRQKGVELAQKMANAKKTAIPAPAPPKAAA